MKISPFDRAHTTSYRRSIVTMAMSRVVSIVTLISESHRRSIEWCVDQERFVSRWIPSNLNEVKRGGKLIEVRGPRIVSLVLYVLICISLLSVIVGLPVSAMRPFRNGLGLSLGR